MEEERKIYLALGISIDRVRAALWEKENLEVRGGGRVVAYGESEFYQDEDNLIEAVRESLRTAWSLASPRLGGERELSGVIFSVPHFWLSSSFQAEKIAVLQRLSEVLTASPLGFISEAEILLSFLKEKEGQMVNLVMVSVGDQQINVVPVVQGKILGSQLVERSNDFALDLEEGLSRFEREEGFAPRFLLLGGGNLEEIRQKVIAYPWLEQEKPLFLHLPKVEIFPYQLILETLVAKMKKEEEKIPSQEEEKLLPSASAPTSASALGFHQGKDVARIEEKKEEDFSFPESTEEKEVLPREKKALKLDFLAGMKSFFLAGKKKIFSFLKKFSLPHRLLLIPLLGLIAFLSAFFASWWFLPWAKVTLLATPRFSQEKFSFLVSSQVDDIKEEERVIPGQRLEVILSKEKEIATSGEDTVGEKAKGEVIIYNGTDIKKTFPPGTLIKGPGDLRFLTQEEVAVASRSGKVKVEAEDIGPDYNLEKGVEFRVDAFSKNDFIAKNENDFQGGSSRKVKVVSEKDQENLYQQLKEELKEEVVSRLKEKVGEGWIIVKESISLEEKEKKFSAAIGEEADSLSLSLTVSASGLAFKEEDFSQLLATILADKMSEEYQLGKEKEYGFNFIEDKDGEALFEAKVKASLYPRLDEEEVKEILRGKKKEVAAQELLASLSGIDDVIIEIWPNFPPFALTMPHRLERIKLEVKIEE